MFKEFYFTYGSLCQFDYYFVSSTTFGPIFYHIISYPFFVFLGCCSNLFAYCCLAFYLSSFFVDFLVDSSYRLMDLVVVPFKMIAGLRLLIGSGFFVDQYLFGRFIKKQTTHYKRISPNPTKT